MILRTVFREGSFRFNGLRIPCMVLNDGTPMLTVRALRLFLGVPSVPGVVTSCVRLDDGEVITDAVSTRQFIAAIGRYEDANWKAMNQRRTRGCKWARGGVHWSAIYKVTGIWARTRGLEGWIFEGCDYDKIDARVTAEMAFVNRAIATGKEGRA